jgi:hypothetical protein
MRTSKRTASDELWMERSGQKYPGIGSIVVLLTMTALLVLIS